MRTLLQFMYNGEVNVTEEFLPILLKTAEALRICGLSTGNESTRDEEVKVTVVYLIYFIFLMSEDSKQPSPLARLTEHVN